MLASANALVIAPVLTVKIMSLLIIFSDFLNPVRERFNRVMRTAAMITSVPAANPTDILATHIIDGRSKIKLNGRLDRMIINNRLAGALMG